MSEKIHEQFTDSLSTGIKSSRQDVTIMFTDIEGSTQLWDKGGDLKGRLMVDMHNRLVHPVIRKYKGKIIKNIGDSVMARFASPDNALKAAIGIQQILKNQRDNDSTFAINVRIGLHTGKALVEKNDVFGDVVNVAARVESFGEGGHICVSGATAMKVKHKEYFLKQVDSFVPKGKRKTIAVFQSDWIKHDSLINGIKIGSTMHMIIRQRYEILLYGFGALALMVLLFVLYGRFFIADNETLALVFLNPKQVFESVWGWLGLGAILGVGLFLFFRWLDKLPLWNLRIIKGMFGYLIAFLLLYFSQSLWASQDKWLTEVKHESDHLFVQVLEDYSVKLKPSEKAESHLDVYPGMILLLTDVEKSRGLTWNKVLMNDEEPRYGWLPRVLPAKIGVPEMRVTQTDKFYVRNADLVTLALPLLAFLWGIFTFRLRPI